MSPSVSRPIISLALAVTTAIASFPSTAKETQSPIIPALGTQGIQLPIKWVNDPHAPRIMLKWPSASNVSAYTSRGQETDDTPCIGARNLDLCHALTSGEYRDPKDKPSPLDLPMLCASNDLPLGSLIWIDSLGACEIRDRMNPRYTGTHAVDVYFGFGKSSLESARAFGRKKLDIWIISQ